MISFDDQDESLERALFAVRAHALPAPRLDMSDVLERASRSPVRCRERDRRLASGARAAWVGAAACAAASYFGVVPMGEPTRDDAQHTMSMSSVRDSDGLACRADLGVDSLASSAMSLGSTETVASIAPDTRTSCLAQDPSALVCAQDVTFSIARP